MSHSFPCRLAALTAALLMLIQVPISSAIEIGGVTLPDSENVEGKPLLLNSVGIRKATILRIKVYAAGLYLEQKNSDAKEIVESTTAKKIDMRFIRAVSADKTVEAWRAGIEASAPQFSASPLLDQLLQSMPDLNPNDLLTISFGTTCSVKLNNKELFSTTDKDFGRAILNIWLGASPPTEELKEGLLGK
jgi:hypothetical protein